MGALVDLAVAEGVDQVLGGDQSARAGSAGIGQAHARILGVVFDVDDAWFSVAADRFVAFVGSARFAVGELGIRQLAGVQVDFLAQSARPPVDAVVEDRDHDVRVTARRLPRAGGVEARDHRLTRVRTDFVDRARSSVRTGNRTGRSARRRSWRSDLRAAVWCRALTGRNRGRSACLPAARCRSRTAAMFRSSRGFQSPRNQRRSRRRLVACPQVRAALRPKLTSLQAPREPADQRHAGRGR